MKAAPSLGRRALLAGLAASLPATARAAAGAPLPEMGRPETGMPEMGRPPPALPAWRRHAVAVDPGETRPRIAIVIDDLGVMRANTARALRLPPPLTLAWFPFAPDLARQAAAGRDRGHETLLHMPMQARIDDPYALGPDPLRVDLPRAVNLARLQEAIAAVPHSVGLNNHMGSLATRSIPLMNLVARQARGAGMLFLDSVTVAHSEGVLRAEALGVPTAARDVFLDNVPHPAAIACQLAITERVARRQGYAIAIGHPHPAMLAALEAWLPTLPARGFAPWPLAATVALRNHLPILAG
ncbi:MAG: divergent polysaccharide deacetylase family protein [Rhodospirillales bacterium]|nr:divergent polysaccharide deacetylase family protein [Rhodospirillales bacterium]